MPVPYRCAIDSNGNFGLAARYFDGKGLGLTLLQSQVVPSVFPIYQLTSISCGYKNKIIKQLGVRCGVGYTILSFT